MPLRTVTAKPDDNHGSVKVTPPSTKRLKRTSSPMDHLSNKSETEMKSCKSEVHPQLTPAVSKLKTAKQHIHNVVTNLIGFPFPKQIHRSSQDLSWMTKPVTIKAMNLHLVHKLILWSKGFLSHRDNIVTNKKMIAQSTHYQDLFVNKFVQTAISGVASCKIPVWLMSQDRMIELIDGIDHLSVADLVKNLSSYDQFYFEHHVSLCSKILYTATIHHGHSFDPKLHQSPGQDFIEVFYGLDAITNKV